VVVGGVLALVASTVSASLPQLQTQLAASLDSINAASCRSRCSQQLTV
jgi:hypothetical protein